MVDVDVTASFIVTNTSIMSSGEVIVRSYIFTVANIISLNISFNDNITIEFSNDSNGVLHRSSNAKAIDLITTIKLLSDMTYNSSTMPNAINGTVIDDKYNITVTCNIHLQSVANFCAVAAISNSSIPIQGTLY